MYQKERIDMILKILRENGYVNVKYLCDEIGYSKATINRDLNYMEKQRLIVRSHGAVELMDNNIVHLEFRYHKMKREKIKLCKAAAELIEDGETIYIDASSTTEFMAQYLIEKKGLTIITDNMAIVSYLSGFSNIKVICLGGEVTEPPSMLGGDLCVKNAMGYKADKFFFATQSINEKGEIGCSGIYNLLLNVMAQNSNKVVYMVDHSKINIPAKTVVMTVDSVDIILSDYIFSEKFKEKYKHVKFIEV